jgi:hypothetical protein
LDAVAPRLYRVTAADASAPLRQGEFLTDVWRQFQLDVAAIGTGATTISPVRHRFVVVMTQDCDLDQDFRVRSEGKVNDKLLPGILFCEVATAQEVFGRIRQTNPKLWERIKINKDERFHFLQKVEPACDRLHEGLPELAIDFKRCFTLPTEEIYKRIEIGEARRRCVLVSPYLEHLSSRFAYFLSRVALPEDHFSEPGDKPR